MSPGSLKELLGEALSNLIRKLTVGWSFDPHRKRECRLWRIGVSSCHCPTEWGLQWLLRPDILTEDSLHVARPGKDSDSNIKILLKAYHFLPGTLLKNCSVKPPFSMSSSMLSVSSSESL